MIDARSFGESVGEWMTSRLIDYTSIRSVGTCLGGDGDRNRAAEVHIQFCRLNACFDCHFDDFIAFADWSTKPSRLRKILQRSE